MRRFRHPFEAALIYTLLAFSLRGFAQANESIALQKQDGAIIRGPGSEKVIALVFTGHEFAEGGDLILSELRRHRAKASFFLTGDFLDSSAHKAAVKRIVQEGHYLGPHSDKHLLYCPWEKTKKTLVSRDEFRQDLENNLLKVERFGVPRDEIRYFLPPFEQCNQQIADWSAELGLTLINYTPGTRSNADYTGEQDKNFVSSKAILNSIVQRGKTGPDGLNGFILVLHIGSGPVRKDKFPSRFGEMMDRLTAEGYRFVRVDGMFGNVHTADIFIRANQIGYEPLGPKNAVAFSSAAISGGFKVLDQATGKPVFEATVKPLAGVKWGTNQHHAELDFSRVHRQGRYVLELADGKSIPFEIRHRVYAELPDQLLQFMREQRCGYNPWLNAVCHSNDARTAFGPEPPGTYLDARGGWHDAADLLKYLLTSENATAQMLLAYELSKNPARKGNLHRSSRTSLSSARENQADDAFHTDRVDAAGRPTPNGVPDILDEARWGLEWMLKLHPAPDQLYHQVADDRDHAGWRLPQDENLDYGWGPGKGRVVYFANGKPQGLAEYKSQSSGLANLAGRYAAAMGLAYQIWARDPQHSEFANRCLKAGLEVYDLGRAKEGVQQGNSYKASYRYEETTWADDMEWGAAELFRATGQARYLQEAKRYALLAADESWMGKEQTGHYQYYPFMNAGHFRLYSLVDRRFKGVLADFYRNGIERCITAAEKNPYRAGVPFIWCSNNLLTALVTQCLMYERMTGDAQYLNFAQKQCDWLLGRNPWGYTMFTEIGSICPRDPHLMTRQITKRPVVGGLVDGPVYERIFKSLKGVSIVEPDPLGPFQGQAVFHDDYHDYSTDEPTLDGTASAILMFALM